MQYNKHVEIRLENNAGYHWYCRKNKKENIWVKGFLSVGDRIVKGYDFLSYIEQLSDEKLADHLSGQDGQYVIVIESASAVTVAVDHIRSFPVLYWKEKEKMIITDALSENDYRNKRVSELQVDFFLNSLFTFDHHTLLEDVYHIPAGHVLTVDNDGSLRLREYWRFQYKEKQMYDLETVVSVIIAGYDSIFKKCAKIIEDRKVIIPLSGGYDSRLVLCGLHKAGIRRENIIAFSYGNAHDKDAQISCEVAEIFGISYHFVPYNSDDARSFFERNASSFFLYAANGISTPCIQEWYAVNKLAEKGVINKDCIFIPGYGGILPGHYLREDMLVNNDNYLKVMKKYIVKMLLGNVPRGRREVQNKLADIIIGSRFFDTSSQTKTVESFERFIYSEEQTKFIMNAVRDYEIVDCEWITPFLFKEQFELWGSVSNQLRLNNLAFMESMNRYFQDDIKNIRFTGSKVRRGGYAYKILNRIRVKVNLILNREKVHYILAMIPEKTYLKYVIPNMAVECNNIVAREYLNTVYDLTGDKKR